MAQDRWEISQEGGRAVITVPGGLDIASSDRLGQAVAAALHADAAEVIVDTSRAARCGLGGIAALVSARRSAEAAGAALSVVAGPAVRQTMNFTGPVTRGLLPQTLAPAAARPRQARGTRQ